MLKYRNVLIGSLVILAGLIIIDQYTLISEWIYAGIIIVILGLFTYGSVFICSDFYCKVFCRAETTERILALTFDDGPDKEITPRVLDLLKEHQVPAAFFCIGHKIINNPGLIKRMDEEGHVIGNHGYSHNYLFDLYSAKRIGKELQTTRKLVYKITGRNMKWFRPPYGVTNPPLAKALKRMRLYAIGWSLKSKDTVIAEEERLFRRISEKLQPGAILLFHDTKKHLPATLEKLLRFARENNYRFERPDLLLKIQAYE
jgi:peptidoglycan/xylan/chitin deacetylase (PgdA/CDA1 family)